MSIGGREGDEFVFPQIIGERQFGEGLLLRDWFAAHVDLQGYQFSSYQEAAEVLGISPPASGSPADAMEFGFSVQAALRYKLADAMLAAFSRATGA